MTPERKKEIIFSDLFAPGGLPPARNPLKIRKIGSLEKQMSFFQIFLSPEGGPPARNPLKIRKIGPLEKQVSFFRFFCPRREDPRLVIHLKSGSGGEAGGHFGITFSIFFGLFRTFFRGVPQYFWDVQGP